MEVRLKRIKNVDIARGGADMLTQPVCDIDRALESLANATEQMKGILIKYSGSNQSRQFNTAIGVVCDLSEKLIVIAEEFRLFQHNIVRIQQRIKIVEMEKTPCATPSKHSITRVNLPRNLTSAVKFDLDEMMEVERAIGNYSALVKRTVDLLKSRKDQLGGVWRDEQYTRLFAPYIDDKCLVIVSFARHLEDYRIFLHNIIAKATSN